MKSGEGVIETLQGHNLRRRLGHSSAARRDGKHDRAVACFQTDLARLDSPQRHEPYLLLMHHTEAQCFGRQAIVELRACGASLLAYPGLQLIYASFALDAPPAEPEVETIFREVDTIARSAGGGYVCEAAPTSAKVGRDMFGALGASGSIVRELKQRFDPTGVLNPGRFAGRN